MTPEQRERFEADGFLRVPGALAGEALEQVQAPIEYDNALLELLWHPTVFPLVRTALGDDVSMIDNDLFLTPPHTPHTHANWHHDVGMPGVFHPRSLLMVKVFYLLTDVDEAMGPTQMVPGSHRWEETPGPLEPVVTMTGNAGDAYLFNGRIYHRAANNTSDRWRAVRMQLLGLGDAYGQSLPEETRH